MIYFPCLFSLLLSPGKGGGGGGGNCCLFHVTVIKQNKTRSNHRLCSAFAMLAIEEHATTRLGCVLLPLSARIVYSLSLSA